jgi:iron(III) transport system substrate-binding protein
MAESKVNSSSVRLLSSMESYELDGYMALIREAMPDLSLSMTRVSTSRLVEVVADRNSGAQFDAIFGTALSAMLAPEVLSQTVPHKTSAQEKLSREFTDREDRWFCPSAYSVALCVSEARLDQLGKPAVRSWDALASSRLSGQLVFPSPLSSGAAYLQITAILQKLGREHGWELLRALDANVRRYTASGLEPCTAVSAGEGAVGASVAIAVAHAIAQGAPVQLVTPTDAAGFEPEAFAVLRAVGDNAAAVSRVLEWTLGAQAQRAFRDHSKLSLVTPTPGSPGSDAINSPGPGLFAIDVPRAARERTAVMEEWRRRFAREAAGIA